MSIFRRIRTLWRLSGIEIEATDFSEYPTYRKKTINKITDVFMRGRVPFTTRKHATILDFTQPDNPVEREIKT